MNAVGGNIKSLRTEKRISREELAKRLGVSVKDVTMWENRTAQPDVQTLENIAKALGADIQYVIYGRKPDPDKRRKQWTAFIIFGALFVLLLALSFWFRGYASYQSERYYNIIPSVIYMGIWRPLLYILGLLSALCAASLMWEFSIYKRASRYAFMASGIAVILLYCAGCIIWSSGYWQSFLPELTEYMAYTPAVFLLPGLLLYLGIKK